ncbi:MAG: zinc/manganese transport system substrate-binding protein [Pseudonocardiales bacterium]|jgi:zinc/manganese transport system substrate-binding protein|nr:zinc/manganese transport system substrate-binding protein [Pseudonocardiales bacterium]
MFSRSSGCVLVVAVALAGSLIAGCSSTPGSNGAGSAGSGASSGQISVVASTDVYGDIVQQIAGSKAKVTSIITNPSADPHGYEADAQNQLALSRAKIVIENGGGYDDFMNAMLKTANNSAAKVLNVVDISGKAAAPGGVLNEHVWYDMPTVARLTAQLVIDLTAIDPAGASTFTANSKTFLAKLATIEATEAAIKAKYSGTAVAITEPVPLYLLQASGLVNKTPAEFSKAVEEANDVPARVLADTLALFNDKQVKLLAYNEQTTGATTAKVLAAAKANNIAVLPVTETLPSGKDYLTWMTDNVNAVQSALAQ